LTKLTAKSLLIKISKNP